MSFRATGLKRRLGVVLLGLVAASGAAHAQALKPPVAVLTALRIGQDYAPQQTARVINFADSQAITVSFVPAPAVGSSESSVGDTNWMKVEFHYSVNPEHPDKLPYVDAVEFKIWIEGRDLYAQNAPGAEGVAICLTGSVTYVNLAAARDAYGVFYVHPSTLARYCGKGSYEDFDRKFNIHIEANVGGKLVDYYDKNKETDLKWYTQPTAVPNLVFRQDQSPFSQTDTAHFPMSKLQTSGGQ